MPGGRVETAHFTFREVREGIFHAVGKPSVSAGSNAALIVGADHLLIVDSHMTPAAARALLADLPAVTDKPVRYVINTHFHFDHVHGNQVFGDQVEILAHEFTRERIAAGDTQRGRGYELYIASIPDRLAELERELETALGTGDTMGSCPQAKSEDGLDVLAMFDKARSLRRQSDRIVPASSSATWRLEGFGRSGEPGGLGPAA